MKDKLDVVVEDKQGDSRLVNPEEDFKSLGDAEANQEVAPTMILEEQISQQLMPTTQSSKSRRSHEECLILYRLHFMSVP
jgi:hypothetical protein